jgi:ATP-dependent Clp protease ATP-binding subunit ClpC
MFNLDLQKTQIYQAVKWSKQPIFKFAGFLMKLFLTLSFIFFIGFIFVFLRQKPSLERIQLLSRLFGFFLIFLVLSIFECFQKEFLRTKIKNPRMKINIEEAVSSPNEYNLAEFLSFEVARAVWKSIKAAKRIKEKEISSSFLLYFLLTDNPKLNFIFSRASLDLGSVKRIFKEQISLRKSKNNNGYFERSEKQGPEERSEKQGFVPRTSSYFERSEKQGFVPRTSSYFYSKNFQDSVIESLKIAKEKKHKRVEVGDMLTALAKNNLVFRKILIDNNLKVEDIESLVWWLESIESKIAERQRIWEYKNLVKTGTLAKEWAAGYTITLDRYSIDWTDIIRQKSFEEVIGHKEQIEQVERILARADINNALLVGEAGSGRGSIIQAIAQRSLFGESLPPINYKRVVEVDMVSLLSQAATNEQAEALLDKILQESISAGNIILVFNEFHNYVGSGIKLGTIDISGILFPYLKSPQSLIIAVTTYAGLHRNIEQNPSLLSLFEKVEVPEISERETIMLLENLALFLENKYKKYVTYPAIREIVRLSDRYFPSIPFPKKAMDLMDEVMVYVAQSTKSQLVLPEHVAKVVFQKTQVPVGEIESKEREILLNLEKLIHQRIINQEEAVEEVSSALRRARADISVRKGPMGCFLFLGPTGVGKTETSKALAEIYFGSENRMIRIDMSEFQAITDIPRLIGSVDQEGLLTTQVWENPFSIVLLDEIEKAHPNVLNLFLQVLDEGHLTDGLGRKIDFKNTIIIATSNAGYLVILEALKKNKLMVEIKQELLDYLYKEGTFRPEFINRFDGVVVFKSLTKENLLDIAELLLQKLKKNLKEKEIEFIITPPLKEKIVELGYDPIFGARQMRRVIQDKVENVLAQALLSGELKRGYRVQIEPKDFKLIINP